MACNSSGPIAHKGRRPLWAIGPELLQVFKVYA
jgi:hypothetical protein